jgi:hypothetical protein
MVKVAAHVQIQKPEEENAAWPRSDEQMTAYTWAQGLLNQQNFVRWVSSSTEQFPVWFILLQDSRASPSQHFVRDWKHIPNCSSLGIGNLHPEDPPPTLQYAIRGVVTKV